MYFGGPEYVRRYDNFKSEIFGKKRDQFKQKYRNEKPNMDQKKNLNLVSQPFVKRFLLLTGLSFSYYYLNERLNINSHIKNYIENSFQMSSIDILTKISLTTLLLDIKRRWTDGSQQKRINTNQNNKFANIHYFNQLEYLLKTLKLQTIRRKILQQNKSNYGIGLLHYNCSQQILEINQRGSVVKRSTKGKFRIGNLYIKGKTQEQVLQWSQTRVLLQRSKIIQQLEQQASHCKTINLMNSILLQKQKSQSIYQQCVSESKKTISEIKQQLKKLKKRQERRRKKEFFFHFS